MGITVRCKKTGTDMDMCSGFNRLRNQVARLVGEPFASHYLELDDTFHLYGHEREAFFKTYDQKTLELIKKKKVPIKVANFLYQSDYSGSIHYGACKMLLKIIGDYDDDIIYGYPGRPHPARFRDFKRLLELCVENKCDLVWD